MADGLPFKGIRERPYSQAILPNGIERKQIQVETIYFRDIYLTQPTLNIMGIFGQQFSTDKYLHVVRWMGENYLEDGHHRAVLAALRHYEFARCRVIYRNEAPQ